MSPPDVPVDVGVVIVTYNSAHVIGDLLNSLAAAMADLSYEVVVVDNGSADDTANVVAARGDCRLIRSTNVGYAGGINKGVQAGTNAEAILILNPDVRMHEHSVPPLLSALREPGVGVAVPKVLWPDGSVQLSLRREPTIPRALGLTRTRLRVFSEYVAEPDAYARPYVADWALGAVMLVSRKCYDALGGWDESYFLYSEETDFSLRARDLGLLTLYEPRSVAVHDGGQSGRTPATHAMQMVNKVRLFRRRNGALASWCYYGLILANQLSRVARGQRFSRSAVAALLLPSRRPRELNCRTGWMPR